NPRSHPIFCDRRGFRGRADLPGAQRVSWVRNAAGRAQVRSQPGLAEYRQGDVDRGRPADHPVRAKDVVERLAIDDVCLLADPGTGIEIGQQALGVFPPASAQDTEARSRLHSATEKGPISIRKAIADGLLEEDLEIVRLIEIAIRP